MMRRYVRGILLDEDESSGYLFGFAAKTVETPEELPRSLRGISLPSPIPGNRMSGPYDIYDLLRWLKIVQLAAAVANRSPLGLFRGVLDLQSYVIENAPEAAVANQELHGTSTVNDPYYISGQFTF
jgi:hypothetical protein